MRFGALGDVHGDLEALHRVIARHPDVPFWVCVGDLGGDEGRYANPTAPVYWIKGNNEDFDFVARQTGTPTYPNLRLVPNGILVAADGVRLAGLGGTYAPTFYDTPAAQLPHPLRAAGGERTAGMIARDRRRHFVREEVEACRRLRHVDLFMSHEAPRPFLVETGRGRPVDAGKTSINEVLTAMQPRLHLFGHHHRFTSAVRQGVPSIGLDLAVRSYLLIDRTTLRTERIEMAS